MLVLVRNNALVRTLHYGPDQRKQSKKRHPIIHFPTSERASKLVSAAELALKASSVEQVNEWCERSDKRVAQYLRLDS